MKEEFIEKINKIINSGFDYGVKTYTLIKSNEELKVKKMLMKDKVLPNKIKEWIISTLINKYMNDEVEFTSIDNISDNRNDIYVLETSNYNPFSMLDNLNLIEDKFLEEETENLFGFIFKFNLNDNVFYVYQHAFVGNKIKGKNVLRIINRGEDKFDIFSSDTLRIDKRADMVIIDKNIYVKNISVLQQNFNFNKYILKEASKVINIIEELGFVSDMKKIKEIMEDDKLTRPKKLMKIKDSPVLKMDKKELVEKIPDIPRYKSIIKIDEGNIRIDTKKDIDNFFKLLNDDLVKSILTKTEYDSYSKKMLLDHTEVI